VEESFTFERVVERWKEVLEGIDVGVRCPLFHIDFIYWILHIRKIETLIYHTLSAKSLRFA